MSYDDMPEDMDYDPQLEEKAKEQEIEDLTKFEENNSDNFYGGIAREILGAPSIQEGLEDLSEKQKYRYKKDIKPSLTEKCGFHGCQILVRIDGGYCGMHKEFE